MARGQILGCFFHSVTATTHTSVLLRDVKCHVNIVTHTARVAQTTREDIDKNC